MKKIFALILLLSTVFLGTANAADQRAQFNERAVGANHPTLSDTINRLALVEHNNDGTHDTINVTDLIIKGPRVDVRWFGAVGDGITDDTTAIENAWDYVMEITTGSALAGEIAWMTVGGPVLYFPVGDYLYTGTGLVDPAGTTTMLNVEGDGPMATRIRIPDDVYFISMANIGMGSIEGIHFYGGKGAIRQSGTGINVRGKFVIRNNMFVRYSECAVGFNSSDYPYITIEDNFFYGKVVDPPTSIGIAITDAGAGINIQRNNFTYDKYHIKVTEGGASGTYINNNDFIRLQSATNVMTDIWIVPRATAVNAGTGLTIKTNKFGNEHLGNNDFRILVADEDAIGSDNLTKHHVATTSTGFWSGAFLLDNTFSGASGLATPIIYSTTPNIFDTYFDNQMDGTYPVNVYGFLDALTDNRNNTNNTIIIRQATDGPNKQFPQVSDNGNIGLNVDSMGYLGGYIDTPTFHTGAGYDPAFGQLIVDDHAEDDGTVGTATKSGITDALGDDDATEITYTGSAGFYSLVGATTNLVTGKHAFLELDILDGTSNSLDSVQIELHQVSSGTIAFRRLVNTPAEWQRLRFPFVPRQSAEAYKVIIKPVGFASSSKEKVRIGRIRLYHANEPVNQGELMTHDASTQTTVGAAGGASALPATPLGYTHINIIGIGRVVIPYYNE